MEVTEVRVELFPLQDSGLSSCMVTTLGTLESHEASTGRKTRDAVSSGIRSKCCVEWLRRSWGSKVSQGGIGSGEQRAGCLLLSCQDLCLAAQASFLPIHTAPTCYLSPHGTCVLGDQRTAPRPVVYILNKGWAVQSHGSCSGADTNAFQ